MRILVEQVNIVNLNNDLIGVKEYFQQVQHDIQEKYDR
jgi:hypothetical protein